MCFPYRVSLILIDFLPKVCACFLVRPGKGNWVIMSIGWVLGLWCCFIQTMGAGYWTDLEIVNRSCLNLNMLLAVVIPRYSKNIEMQLTISFPLKFSGPHVKYNYYNTIHLVILQLHSHITLPFFRYTLLSTLFISWIQSLSFQWLFPK